MSPFRLLWLVPLGALIVRRDLRAFVFPRFWAEEGTNYFHAALERGALDALTNPRAASYVPYLNPIPHVATVAAAHLVPLEWAPAVTTAAWTIVVLSVLAVVLLSRAELFDQPWRRGVAALVPLVAVSNSENWVSTLGAHYFCDLALLLLLLEAPRVDGRRRTASLCVFGLFALSSPSSWLLLPAAVLLDRRNRAAHRAYLAVLAVIVGLHAVLDLAVFWPPFRHRPDLFAAPHLFVDKLVVWPLGGHVLAQRYAELALRSSDGAFRATALALGSLVIALYAFAFRFWRRDTTALALLATHLTAALAFLLLGLHVERETLGAFNGGRYVWLPNALLILLLSWQAGVARWRAPQKIELLRSAPFALAFAVALFQYRFPEAVRNASRAPSWRSEVAQYRNDPSYRQLRIAPVGWVVDMP